MLSRELLSDGIQEFIEYSLNEPSKIRHRDHEIYRWRKDGRGTAIYTVSIPSLRSWPEGFPDEMSKTNSLIETLITDDDLPLIQSNEGAKRAFNRIIKEIRIESSREEFTDAEADLDFWDAIHSNETWIEYISPIIGLTFDDRVQITDNLVIRRLNEVEKELMLNTRDLGGGSIALRRAAQIGNLTHAAVYKNTKTIEDGWEGGFGHITEMDHEAQDALENLKIALRLIHPEGFQMSVRHILDKTIYPSIASSHEKRGSIAHSAMAEPVSASDGDKIIEYYQLVSKANEDEGLRVAINRLESSYRKISNADGVVDAVIGIEALLSAGRGGSFQEVRRRAAVLSGKKATYSELGRLQSLRNATVHGEETRVDRDDLRQARDLLSVLLGRVISITIEKNVKRDEVIDILDTAITQTIENRFEELLSEFESM